MDDDVIDESNKGWVKPQPMRTLTELRDRISELRIELAGLELEAYNREHGPRLEVIARINNIMRAHDITIADIATRSKA